MRARLVESLVCRPQVSSQLELLRSMVDAIDDPTKRPSVSGSQQLILHPIGAKYIDALLRVGEQGLLAGDAQRPRLNPNKSLRSGNPTPRPFGILGEHAEVVVGAGASDVKHGTYGVGRSHNYVLPHYLCLPLEGLPPAVREAVRELRRVLESLSDLPRQAKDSTWNLAVLKELRVWRSSWARIRRARVTGAVVVRPYNPDVEPESLENITRSVQRGNSDGYAADPSAGEGDTKDSGGEGSGTNCVTRPNSARGCGSSRGGGRRRGRLRGKGRGSSQARRRKDSPRGSGPSQAKSRSIVISTDDDSDTTTSAARPAHKPICPKPAPAKRFPDQRADRVASPVGRHRLEETSKPLATRTAGPAIQSDATSGGKIVPGGADPSGVYAKDDAALRKAQAESAIADYERRNHIDGGAADRLRAQLRGGPQGEFTPLEFSRPPGAIQDKGADRPPSPLGRSPVKKAIRPAQDLSPRRTPGTSAPPAKPVPIPEQLPATPGSTNRTR